MSFISISSYLFTAGIQNCPAGSMPVPAAAQQQRAHRSCSSCSALVLAAAASAGGPSARLRRRYVRLLRSGRLSVPRTRQRR